MNSDSSSNPIINESDASIPLRPEEGVATATREGEITNTIGKKQSSPYPPEAIKPFLPTWRTLPEKNITALGTIMQKNNMAFFVHQKRKRVSLYYKNRCVAKTPQNNDGNEYLTHKQILGLIAVVARSVNTYLKKNDFNIPLISQRHPRNFVNHELYDSMKIGQPFYFIDANHCFWRIAFLNSIISKNLYHKWANKPGVKSYLSQSLACIVAPDKRTYYYNNGKQWTFISDKRLHAQVYDNIRFTSYNLMGDLKDLLDGQCIAYKTDGIMVDRKYVAAVRDYLESNNYLFKITKYRKADNTSYYDEDHKRLRKM